MTKQFLSEQECSIIQGSKLIIKKLGGFPAMEGAFLEQVRITNIKESDLKDIELVYDIAELNAIIKLSFSKVRKIKYDPNAFLSEASGPVSFGNSKSANSRRKDAFPGVVTVIERPFSCFYEGNGKILRIDFNESECEIKAKLEIPS